MTSSPPSPWAPRVDWRRDLDLSRDGLLLRVVDALAGLARRALRGVGLLPVGDTERPFDVPEHALLGLGPRLGALGSYAFFAAVDEWAKERGVGVARFSLGPRTRHFYVRDRAAAEEVLANFRVFDFYSQDRMFGLLLPVGGHRSFFRNRVKKHANQEAEASAVHGPALGRVAALVAADWERLLDASDAARITVDLTPVASRVTVDGVLTAFVGLPAERADALAQESRGCAASLAAYIGRRKAGTLPFTLYWGLGALLWENREFERTRARLRSVIEAATAEERGASKDLFVATAKTELEGGEFSFLKEIMGLVIAGSETTSRAFAFAVWELAQRPDLQLRVLDELRAAAPGLAADEPASFDHVAEMHLLHRVVDETLRLFPPLYLLKRDVLADVALAGVPVPKGSFVWTSPLFLHRDAAAFRDPHSFDPDRPELLRYSDAGWDGPAGPARRWTEDVSAGDAASWVFGRGLKFCPGRRFARLEMELVLLELLRRFEFAGARPLSGLREGFALMPTEPLLVDVRRRA